MKSKTHPDNYRLVAFKDMSNNDVFLTKSTVETKETTKIDGVEYPLFKLEISRTSHPYYTGKSKLVDTAGRVDKFRSKYANFNQASATEEAPAAEEAPADVEAPVAEEAPADVEATAAEEAPAAVEAPAAGEAPATEEAPAAEESPNTEEINDSQESEDTDPS